MKHIFRIVLILSSCLVFTSAKSQSWLWATGSTIGNGEGYDVAADDSGNVYVVGDFPTSSIGFGSVIAPNISAGTSDLFLAKFDALGNVLWARSAGGVNIDEAFGITVDASGAVYIAGTFYSDTIIFGADTLFNAGGGWGDVLIAKYDPSGNVLWAKGAGGISMDKASAIYADINTGYIFITGFYTSPTITFGSFTLTNTSFSNDIFLVKYDASGNVIWAQNGGGTSADVGYSVATDNSGNVFLTGYFFGSAAVFGSVSLTNSNMNSADEFLVKYDGAGNALWGRNAGGFYGAVGYDVATDPNGNSFITGYYDSTITFGTYTLSTTATTASDEVFIVKYDASGNVLWAKSSETPTTNTTVCGYSIATDINGNVYTTGGFMNTTSISFDFDTLTQPSTAPDPMYILKLDPNGNVICANSLKSGGDDNNGVLVRKGIIYVGGDFIGNMIVGQDTLFGNNSENIFVARYQCDLSSVEEQSDDSEIKIYPNPSTGIFNLDFGKTNFSSAQIQVYDVLGKMILQFTINNPASTIDLSGNSPGIYFYRIVDEKGIVDSGKIILE